jgi:hypothetical protein
LGRDRFETEAGRRSLAASAPFGARYRAVSIRVGGRCPIEAGLLGRLADHECRHGRLPFDRTAPCGCWTQEGAAVLALRARRAGPSANERAA